MNVKNSQNEINFSVDAGIVLPDIYMRLLDLYFTITNDETGIKQALVELEACNITL
jgi:transposase